VSEMTSAQRAPHGQGCGEKKTCVPFPVEQDREGTREEGNNRVRKSKERAGGVFTSLAAKYREEGMPLRSGRADRTATRHTSLRYQAPEEAGVEVAGTRDDVEEGQQQQQQQQAVRRSSESGFIGVRSPLTSGRLSRRSSATTSGVATPAGHPKRRSSGGGATPPSKLLSRVQQRLAEYQREYEDRGPSTAYDAPSFSGGISCGHTSRSGVEFRRSGVAATAFPTPSLDAAGRGRVSKQGGTLSSLNERFAAAAEDIGRSARAAPARDSSGWEDYEEDLTGRGG
jgi:hypothetical protein